MNFIRIILILFGIGLLVTIWWWERRRRIPPNHYEQELLKGIGIEIRTDGSEASLDFSGLDGITANTDSMPEMSPTIVAEATLLPVSLPIVEEMLVVVNLVAPVDHPYDGHDLIVALQDAHLVYGEMSIFHHYVKGCRRPLFSMANMVEPGIFNPLSIDDFVTPGLTFFMRLPAQVDGPQAMDRLFQSVQYLAAELGGNLADQHRRTLDSHALAKLRAEVRQYQQRINDAHVESTIN